MKVGRIEEISPDGQVRIVEDSGLRELQQEIRGIAVTAELTAFDKRREIADLVHRGLEEEGSFIRTRDGRGFFFSNAERKIFDIEQTHFQYLVTAISGLSSTETYLKFALDTLRAKVAMTAALADLHTFAHFDPQERCLAVSNSGGGIWLRERGGVWRLTSNGTHGIFFITEPDGDPFEPEFGDGEALGWFLGQFPFSDSATELVRADDARALFSIFALQQFFPPLRRTRVIPTFLGPQGSGKTTGERLFGRLLLGDRFEVSGLSRDREDAFVAAISNRVVLGLDNADSRIPWLADSLALYATGQRFRLRRLYTTNEEAVYDPRAILLISSRDPRFNRPDVCERLLPFHFERPESYVAEEVIFSELARRQGRILGALLDRAGQIADSLNIEELKPIPFRMADFAAFGLQALGSENETTWLDLLARVERAQVSFAAEGDGIIATFSVYLNEVGDVLEKPTGEVFRELTKIAERESLPFPRTAQGFGRALQTRRRVLELECGVTIQESKGHGNVRLVTIRRREQA
jgi:hypothetical protein